ncbi:MBL fold metallo-hydrolase [Parvularcula sp. LCG005]|uniref:MBL fold metallo-hydrolase n=1 Tax=Parvularcula sp. LCG005 TaxID=3078805 RepID=UPI002943A1EF|nr:MBL fold metallo-hydrolase [Parvularcula sp. LCG005]WOI53602.1 MBL fold metallo-hydrolase [Parvularcula sp. LCG005]
MHSFPFDYGRLARLSDRVGRVIAKNPGPYTFTGSGTYLVGDHRGVAVIDPGPDDAIHIGRVVDCAPGPITHILITHTHLDHSGGTAKLKALTGATVCAFGAHSSTVEEAPPALDEGADFCFAPDRMLSAGDTIEGPGWTIEAVHTPGHTDNHLCYALREERALFTGDHIMGWSTTVVAPPDGNMDDYLASLDLLLARADHRYYPTHGAPIDDPMPFVQAVAAHRQMRDASILAAAVGRSIPDIVKTVYADTPAHLHMAAGLNVRAHLERHVRAGRVKVKNGLYTSS